jgi:hypothetical protein
MGMEEALERVRVVTVAINDGTVGVATLVGLGVVTPVIGNPG